MKDRSLSRLVMRSVLTACLALAGVTPAFAQIPSAGVDDFPGFHAPAEPQWQRITVADVEAAYRLLHDSHPGAASEMHDTLFVQRLGEAHAQALQRARTVESYQGYLAVLAGFATAMGDKHIWSRPTFVVSGDSREVGPFAPALTYNGDIADTAAVEQWISGTVVKQLRSAQTH